MFKLFQFGRKKKSQNDSSSATSTTTEPADTVATGANNEELHKLAWDFGISIRRLQHLMDGGIPQTSNEAGVRAELKKRNLLTDR